MGVRWWMALGTVLAAAAIGGPDLAVAGAAASAPTAKPAAPRGQAPPGPKVVFIDFRGLERAAPREIYLSANPGPYLTDLRWTGWGTSRASASGTYISQCPSCYPPRRRPATLVLRRLSRCPRSWRGVYVYAAGSLTTIPDGSLNRHRRATVPVETGYYTCHHYPPTR